MRGTAAFLLAMALVFAPGVGAQRAVPLQQSAAQTAYNRGLAYEERREWEQALAAYEEAERGFAEAGRTASGEDAVKSKTGLASASQAVGLMHYARGRLEEAVRCFERSIGHRLELGDKAGMSAIWNNLGILRRQMGRHAEAVSCYEKSLSLKEELGDKVGAATTRMNIGVVWGDLGEYAKALSHYEQSFHVMEKAGDAAGMAQTLNNIGHVHSALGDYAKAFPFYERSLRLLEKAGAESETALTLNNMGSILDALGDYAKALHFFERSQRIAQASGNKRVAAAALLNAGSTLRSLGDRGGTLSAYRRSLAMFEAVGDAASAARALNNIGIIHDVAGDHARALSFFETSLAIKRERNDKPGVAAGLHNIGVLHGATGNLPLARDYYLRSLAIKEEIGDRQGEAETFSVLCDTRYGKPEEILPHGARALQIAMKIDSPELIYRSHTALGAVFAAQARSAERGARSEENESAVPSSALRVPRSEALRHFRSAIAVAESMRSLLSESDQKSGFLGTKLGAYESLVELLVDSQWSMVGGRKTIDHQLSTIDSAAEAFAVAERMKARAFLDELGAAKFSRAGVSEELLQEKRLLEARIKWLRERQ